MTPFKVNCQETKQNRKTRVTMTPIFYVNVLKTKPHFKFKVNCPETKQNTKTIFPMTLNKIDDTFFPTHANTHFLSKYVDNLTPSQIKLSRNKEKQTDNIQTSLFLFFILFLFLFHFN